VPSSERSSRRPSLKSGLSLIGLLVLSACASQQGIQSQAKLRQLDPQLVTQNQNKTAAWPNTEWAKQFGGEQLQSLIQTALENHPSLDAARARIQAASAMSAVVVAHQKAGMALNGNSTYQRFTEHGLVPPPLAGAYESDNNLTLGVSYDFDFWHRHSAEIKAVVSQEKMLEAEQQAVRLNLSHAIARTWLQLARQYQQLELSEEQLALRTQLDQLAAQRYKKGLDNVGDTQLGQMQLANLKNEIQAWHEAIALSRNQLAALLGAGPDRMVVIDKPTLTQSADAWSLLPSDLPLELLARRPDISATRWRIEAMQAEVDVAKTDFYPNINLSAFVGLSSLGIENFVKTGSGIVGGGPAIHMPIFAGNRLRAQLSGKVANYDLAVAQYNQSLIDAVREVADQVQTMQTTQVQAKQQSVALQAASAQIQLAQQRFAVGLSNQVPSLQAKSAYLQQKKCPWTSKCATPIAN